MSITSFHFHFICKNGILPLFLESRIHFRLVGIRWNFAFRFDPCPRPDWGATGCNLLLYIASKRSSARITERRWKTTRRRQWYPVGGGGGEIVIVHTSWCSRARIVIARGRNHWRTKLCFCLQTFARALMYKHTVGVKWNFLEYNWNLHFVYNTVLILIFVLVLFYFYLWVIPPQTYPKYKLATFDYIMMAIYWKHKIEKVPSRIDFIENKFLNPLKL